MVIPVLLAALLYPTVVRTDGNLFADAKWTARTDALRAEAQSWSQGKGGPFSSDEPTWRVESSIPESCFWRQDVRLKTGRRYLVGMWFKSENARALIWCWSRKKGGKPFNERIYLYGGFNSCLTPYIRPAVKEKLCGDSDRWKLIYRPLAVDEPLEIPVQFKFGIYMSTGAVTMAHPFLVDITESRDLSLTAQAEQPVKSLTLTHLGLRDAVLSKTYASPVEGLVELLADKVDMLRGFDQDQVDGHLLTLRYADGSVETVSAPQEHAFLVRP